MAAMELKPCPFCGKQPYDIIADIYFSDKTSYAKVKIGCFDCALYKLGMGGIKSENRPDDVIYGIQCAEKQAAKAWNRRYDDV